MYEGFYRDKVVLVTGIAGVTGTWLGWHLLEAGVVRVVGVDSASGPPESCFQASGLGLDERVSLHAQDVRDLEGLRDLMCRERVEVAAHLAAMAIVGECADSPLACYSANTLGTATFLEAVRSAEVARALVVTTDKVYRNKGGEPWVEDDPLGATGPYAVSKACADLIAQDYLRSYLPAAGTHGAIARSGNVVAPGDHHPDRIVPSIVQALARGEAPVIFNPAFTRPYTFVGDTVSGYLTLLARCHRPEVDGQAFNFGAPEGRGVPNSQLASMVCDQWGSGIAWQRGSPRDEPFEHQSLDWSKAERLLGWRPAYSLEHSIAEVVAWEKARLAHPQAGALRELALEIVRRHRCAAREQGISWAA